MATKKAVEEVPVVHHPAKFSTPILKLMAERLEANINFPVLVLDPFAGSGRVHELANENVKTIGLEIEPEWANQHPDTIVGDARDLPWADGTFDVVVTSPTYGNRLADHHAATDSSRRITYKHTLGRDLSPGNSGAMQWGAEYRTLHRRAWHEVARVLKPSEREDDRGIFILNVSNHIRKKDEQRVAEWHLDYCLNSCGFRLLEIHPVETRRMRFGANGTSRVAHEYVYVMRQGS